MTLLIIVTGLALLVPDRDRGQIHLLFPEVDMSHPGMEHHFPHLEYTSGPTWERVPLDNWQLDLTSVATAGTAGSLPAEVIDLGGVFARGVPRDWIRGFPSRRVVGHVVLPWPTDFETGEKAFWIAVAGNSAGEIELTNRVVLRYDHVPTLGGNWTLRSLPAGPGGSRPLAAWTPAATLDSIRISNEPAGGGEELGLGEEGVHFQAYVDLLRLPGEHQRQRPRLYLNSAGAGSPYNCMLATAAIRP